MSAIFTEKELRNYSITKALSEIVASQNNLPPGADGYPGGLEGEVSYLYSAL